MDPKVDNNTSLSQFYNDLKSDMNKPAPNPMMKVSGGMMGDHMHPGAHHFRHHAAMQAKELANGCHQHMLLDIYMKTIPLDQDYVCGHQGQMNDDINSMLAAKGMNATQYLTSCYEATHAPLIEFLLRAGNTIGQQFKEKAEETLKDAQKKNIEVPAPDAPKVDSNEVQDQLVDVKQDPEYANFIDKLKEKTISKIVSDVSKIISNKQDEKAMTFDTSSGTSIADAEAQTESTVSIGVNYVQKRLIKESLEPDDDAMNSMLGLAIREATLNEINTCFKQPGTTFREYANRIRLGKGYVITEGALQTFTEELSARAKQAVNEVAAKKAENATKLAEDLEQDQKDEKAGAEKIKKSVEEGN